LNSSSGSAPGDAKTGIFITAVSTRLHGKRWLFVAYCVMLGARQAKKEGKRGA